MWDMYIYINFIKDFFYKYDKGLNFVSYVKKFRRGLILGFLWILGFLMLFLNKCEFCFLEMFISFVYGFIFIDWCLFFVIYLYYVSLYISYLMVKFRILYLLENDLVIDLFIC